MALYDRRLLRPTHLLLLNALQEATAAGDPDGALLNLDRDHWQAFVSAIRGAPEGQRQWQRNRFAHGDAGLVGIAWWTDHVGRRHFRAWAGHSADGSYARLLCADNDPRPPLAHLYPDRVFGARSHLAKGAWRWLAFCPCGACGPPHALAWMGERCGACHDQSEEGDPRARPETPCTFQHEDRSVSALAFSPDGRALVSVAKAGPGFRWALDSGERRRLEPGLRRSHSATALAFSGDGQLVASVGADQMVVLNDVATGAVHSWFAVPPGPTDLAFAPDNLLLAVATPSVVELWERKGRAAVWEPTHQWPGAEKLAFSPQGDQLVLGGPQQRLALVDPRHGGAERPLRMRTVLLDTWALAFAADGQTVVSLGPSTGRGGGGTCLLRTADVTTGDERNAVEVPWHGPTVLSADGDWLACGVGHDVAVVRCDGTAQARLSSRPGENVTCLAFSPDGQTLATGGQAGTIKLWPWRRLLAALEEGG